MYMYVYIYIYMYIYIYIHLARIVTWLLQVTFSAGNFFIVPPAASQTCTVAGKLLIFGLVWCAGNFFIVAPWALLGFSLYSRSKTTNRVRCIKKKNIYIYTYIYICIYIYTYMCVWWFALALRLCLGGTGPYSKTFMYTGDAYK